LILKNGSNAKKSIFKNKTNKIYGNQRFSIKNVENFVEKTTIPLKNQLDLVESETLELFLILLKRIE